MLNQVVLVGRVANTLEIVEEGETKKCYMLLSVQRSFKNNEGEYESDLIDIELNNHIAENAVEYCKQGDIVGIKGRVQTIQEMGETKNNFIVADKLTFLSSKSDK